MSILEFCQWLEMTPLGVEIQQSVWWFPLLNVAHVLGMAVAAGTIAFVDLRLLGLGIKKAPITHITGNLLPWVWGGFVVMFISGSLLIASEAVMLYGNLAFRLKLCLLVLTGINVLALAERQIAGLDSQRPANTQIDRTRSITIEFDANARGPWHFKPAQNALVVHPGELTTVMYEFENRQNRTISAQAIPSYAPSQAATHFNKLECFCFNQYTLAPGEKKQWPVAFVIDPKLSRDVSTITLSYTFFEVGGKTPAAPQANRAPAATTTALTVGTSGA